MARSWFGCLGASRSVGRRCRWRSRKVFTMPPQTLDLRSLLHVDNVLLCVLSWQVSSRAERVLEFAARSTQLCRVRNSFLASARSVAVRHSGAEPLRHPACCKPRATFLFDANASVASRCPSDETKTKRASPKSHTVVGQFTDRFGTYCFVFVGRLSLHQVRTS